MALHLHSVTIVVSNMAKSIAFYRTLGLQIADNMEQEPFVDCMADGTTYICLVSESTVTTHRPHWVRNEASSSVSLHFKLDKQGDVDVIHTRFMNHNYESSMQPYDAPWGERYAQVLDPDGHTIALFASLK